MGYITNFEFFRCEGPQPEFDTLLRDIDDLLDANGDVADSRYYEGKWYTCEKDLAEISKKHPGVGFGVAGQGEDPTDRWTAWFLDGDWYMECNDCRLLKWEDAKVQMKHPSRVRRAVQRVDDAYEILLGEILEAVRDGSRVDSEDAFGFVYDDSDGGAVLHERRVTDLRLARGIVYARLEAPQGTDGESPDDWYPLTRNLNGDFHATVYSIATAMLD